MSRAISALLLTCSVFLSAVLLLGCGNSKAVPPPPASTGGEQAVEKAQPPTAAIAETVHIDAAQLTVDDYLPPLDGGRIEIAPPSGWRPMPRDSKYLIRFYKQDRNALPRLNVTVEDGAVGGISDATAENIPKIAAALGDELAGKGTALVEPVVPLVIGDVPCARYVSHLNLKLATNTIRAERQTLVVVRSGRRYVIDLLVLPNRLLQGRDAAYAVCAGLKFPSIAAGSEPANPAGQ